MKVPDAVLKHDGRSVAFEAARLEASIAHAASHAREALPGDAARRLARQIVECVCEAALAAGKSAIGSSDLRALTVDALRRLQFGGVADAYLEYSRGAVQALWRVRVADPALSRDASAVIPWDRRRLLESLRASGVPFDLAGMAARDVERRVVAMGAESLSPALIHALAMMALPPEAHGVRAYRARRVAFSATEHLPHWKAAAAVDHPLPPGGMALEQFWLQGVHSPKVVRAVQDNLLSLDPCPASPDAFAENPDGTPQDPLSDDFSDTLKRCFCGAPFGLNVRADSPERLTALAECLARNAADQGAESLPGAKIKLLFKAVPVRFFEGAKRAGPVTLNAGGLVAREGLRDAKRAAARLGELARLAARAHREREEFFLLSPVRGRILPIAVAGLWNATAWLLGAGFDATRAAIGARETIAPLCQALRTAVEELRSESGMELVLTATAPLSAERSLWRNDRSFFLCDGTDLDTAAAYESGPELKLSSAMRDFTNRMDFAKAVGAAFDEPPELTLELPPEPQTTAAQWNELFDLLAKAGVARLRLTFGGSARTVPNLTRAIRDYLIGFPLLDPVGK